MKLITGWIMSAGLVLAGTAANAQVLAPSGAGRSHYTVVSDVGGPYAAMRPKDRRIQRRGCRRGLTERKKRSGLGALQERRR